MAFNNNKGEFEFPYDIIDVDPEINSELLKDFTGVNIIPIFAWLLPNETR